MRHFNTNLGKILAIAAAIGVLATAPLGIPLRAVAQVSSQDRSEGIENGLSLIVDTVRARIADVIDDARSDDDTDDDYNDLVDDVSSNDNIEEDIQDSLDDAGTIVQDISSSDDTEIASVLTEFSGNEQVVEAQDLPDNITQTSVQNAVDTVSVDDVAEQVTIEAITDEVLENDSGLVTDVQDILGNFVSDALTHSDADITDLVRDVRNDIEDAVDANVDENEVGDIISSLSENDVEDAINGDDISIDAASTQALIHELEHSNSDNTVGNTTTSSAQTEIDMLQQQINNLNARIAELNAIFERSDSNTTSSTTQSNTTSPFT